VSRCDGTRVVGDARSVQGSLTRRRLLALLGSLPITAVQSGDAGQWRADRTDVVAGADPMPRLFAEFQALLDRHAAAIVARDGIEAALVERIGWPRVALPGDADSELRYLVEFAEITRVVPPGRRRQRLTQRLRRRQRRWDTAAQQAGLLEAELHEASVDGAVRAAADGLLATPAWTCHAVVLKLIVLLSVHAPGTVSDSATPWRELRLILADLNGLAACEARGR
jgi:hypothetical protein